MKIKICGMRDEANIQALAILKPDYLGLIFYADSGRYVGSNNLAVLESLSPEITVTGVFVNASPEFILDKVINNRLKAVQLHGQETPEYCLALKRALNSVYPEVKLIKAFGIDEFFDFTFPERYMPVVDFFLFDTKTPAHGGSGIKFNWRILENYKLDKPYFLSGGIGLSDLETIKEFPDPRLYAIDLNSKFEVRPGLKDINQVAHAIDILKSPSNNCRS